MKPAPRTLLLLLGLALFVTVLETVGIELRHALEHRPLIWGYTFTRTAIVWFMFIPLVPFCAFMARRFPIGAANWTHRVPLHVVAGLAFCVVHLAINIVAQAAVGGNWPREFGRQLAMLFGYYIAVETIIYWGIAVTFMMLDAQREEHRWAEASDRLEAALSKARLDALRSELQPHFLFNALNGIAVLARKGEAPRVVAALGELGELLRATLDAGAAQEMPLARELDYVGRYCALQRLRFPDRLTLTVDVPDDVRSALVPAFMLLPIVENAIHHGLSRVGGGRVSIRAVRDGETLELTVEDDGPGFGAGPPRERIGLSNTRQRLAQLYSADQSLECASPEGAGAVVRIRVPLRTADEARSA